MDKISKQGYVLGTIGLLLGGVLGALLALSFLRTVWAQFHPDFFFFATIITTIFGIVSAVITIVQMVEAKGEKRKYRAQVSSWLESSKGVLSSLSQLQELKFSKMEDLKNSIQILETAVSSFMQSLYRANSINPENSDKDDERFAKASAMKSYPLLSESVQGNKKSSKSLNTNPDTKTLKEEVIAAKAQ